MKKWMIYAKKADFQGIAARFSIDQVTARVLRNREVNSDGQIQRFLNGTLEDLHSPMLLPDAIRCMNRLDRAVSEGRHIRVVGDYDVDGVCATYIFYEGLRALGAKVDYAIPDRIRDGYGINVQMIDAAKADGVELILTCDNGISAIDELKHAREMGLSVLVTDHHDVRQNTDEDYGCESRDILPPADAVVDAKRESSRYPYPEICGAVVAWKLIQLLYQKRNRPVEETQRFLEFAAIATVCDVVKLQDENRIIVKYGLEKIKNTENVGLRALLTACGLDEQTTFTAYHAGFVIGPCINAGGRLRTAMLVMELFLSENAEEAMTRAVKLKELNDARKDMTKEATDAAVAEAESGYAADSVLVVYLPTLHESLAGIVAGRLREAFYKPSFVLTDAEPLDGVPMVKGSGRSIEGYPMSTRLAEVSELLTKFGGHPMAAGFSLPQANVGAFRKELNTRARLTPELLTEKLWIDVPMPLSYVTEELVTDLEKLAPFGMGNEKPQFAWKNLTVGGLRVMGKSRNVVRLDLFGDGQSFTGIYFGDGDRFLQECGQKKHMDIVYYPNVNEYNGRKNLQFVIQDYRFFD